MTVNKKRVGDRSDAAKLDLNQDLEERVFSDLPSQTLAAIHLPDEPGKSIIESALADRDTRLLRDIAAERKGLTDQQRRALLLVADFLDQSGDKHGRAR